MIETSSHKQYNLGTGISVASNALMISYSLSIACALLERSFPGGFFLKTNLRPVADVT